MHVGAAQSLILPQLTQVLASLGFYFVSRIVIAFQKAVVALSTYQFSVMREVLLGMLSAIMVGRIVTAH